MTGNECKDIPSLKIVSTLVLAEQSRREADLEFCLSRNPARESSPTLCWIAHAFC